VKWWKFVQLQLTDNGQDQIVPVAEELREHTCDHREIALVCQCAGRVSDTQFAVERPLAALPQSAIEAFQHVRSNCIR